MGILKNTFKKKTKPDPTESQFQPEYAGHGKGDDGQHFQIGTQQVDYSKEKIVIVDPSDSRFNKKTFNGAEISDVFGACCRMTDQPLKRKGPVELSVKSEKSGAPYSSNSDPARRSHEMGFHPAEGGE